MTDTSSSEKIDPINDDCLTVIRKLKKKLLDLTGRNRLISYTHTKTSSLRIIDELPNQLIGTLLEKKKKMVFRPVQEPTEEELIEKGYLALNKETGEVTKLKDEPTAEQWAKEMYGLNTSYEMPEPDAVSGEDEKHTDTNIQTLLYPNELETKLRSLFTKAKSSIDESGLNTLYLMLGFVEWYESNSSDKPRQAPLFILPVTLEKGKLDPESKNYHYRASYSGEEIIANQSLIIKMKNDFGIAFPEQGEDTAPEEFFGEIEKIVSRKNRWKVRRYITLGLLSFRKQVLLGDLTSDICESETIKAFLSEEEEEKDGSFDDEHDIDQEENIHSEYPLIYEADSSQHSVIMDVLAGKSLVVEGPPGTGKSQTITNMIAGAIANGKKVLFVAEKLAALEVVKKKLDEAGLGDFCLELHSHKAKRADVYGAINKRILDHRKHKNPRELDVEIEGYETLKRQLIAHVEEISKKWGKTDLTIGKILNTATRYRLLFGEHTLATNLTSDLFKGEQFTPLESRLLKDKFDSILDIENIVIEKLGGDVELRNHPWFGVQNKDLIVYDAQAVNQLLLEWTQSLERCRELVREVYDSLSTEFVEISTVEAKQLSEELLQIPVSRSNLLIDVAIVLSDAGLDRAKEHLDLFYQIEGLRSDLQENLSSAELLEDHGATSSFAQKSSTLRKQFSIDPAVSELHGYQELASKVVDQLQSISDVINEILKVFDRSFEGKSADLQLVTNIIQSVITLDQKEWGNRDDSFDNDDLDLVLPEITEKLDALSSDLNRAGKHFNIDKLLEAENLEEIHSTIKAGGLLRWFKSRWRQAKKDLISLSEGGGNFDNMKKNLAVAIQVRDGLTQINDDRFYREVLGDRFQAHHTDLEHIEKMRAWYKQVRTQFGVGFGPMVQIGSQILSLDKSTLKAITAQEKQGLRGQIDDLVRLHGEAKSVFSDHLFQGNDTPYANNGDVFFQISEAIKSLGAQVAGVVRDQGMKLSSVEVLSKGVEEYWKRVGKWRAERGDHTQFGSIQLEIGMAANNPARQTIESTIMLADYISNVIKTPLVKESVLKNLSTEWVDRIKVVAQMLGDAVNDEQGALRAFSEKVDLDYVRWTNGRGRIDQLVDRNKSATDSVDDLSSWISYIQSRGDLVDMGFEPIINLLEMGNIDGEAFVAGCWGSVYASLAGEIIENNKHIKTFSGNHQTSVQNRFIEYDKKLLQLQRNKIAWRADQNKVPAGTTAIRSGDLTEMRLIEYQCRLTRPSAPIRKLVNQAGRALKSLMPCFMMSPMSAANYIQRGVLDFDMVIMDEASQIRPEDAIGVISKAKQVVVVGDQKQLPPTSFFNMIVRDGDDEDGMIIDDSESILEVASTRFASRRLRWHYRSQHESLIAFSNSRFYNDDLVIFPSPHEQSKEFGIQFERIRNGVFQNKINLEEVKVIVEAVKHHVAHCKDESLGIVAMNVQQMDAIERGIETAIKNSKEFEVNHQLFTKNNEEIFIKNLETVQGDERDVIFISMTYGPPTPGAMTYQRFGPINAELGWRRLNVLFTRSRKRMHVFSSMGSESIRVAANSMRGVRELRNFFKFCETGEIFNEEGASGRPPDSDFEIAVARELEKYGYECKAQIGVSGFFIDLAVVDPYMPSRYLMGVECDGATYHSAKSARDRDRLRQEILERLGWRIRRIWSTDWFMNPQAEIRPILEELDQLKAASRQEVSEYAEEPETEVIDEIIEEADREEELVDAITSTGESLQEQLEQFNEDVIKKEIPDIPASKRLLRPAMIEALVEHMPIDDFEFLEMIPGYLRGSIDAKEGRYLSDVFNIINAAFDK